MSQGRRAYATGHAPKCLVVVDDTSECDHAVRYASRWAMRSGGSIVMLRVIETEDLNQQWLGVADIMRAEAEEEADAAIDRAAGQAYAVAALAPERVIRRGDAAQQIVEVIRDDLDICMLVLAASAGAEGPGPLITLLAKASGTFPVPLVIVPGHLADADIDALS